MQETGYPQKQSTLSGTQAPHCPTCQRALLFSFAQVSASWSVFAWQQ